LQRAVPAINIAPLVGHGTLRIAAGIGSRVAIDARDSARLLHLLQECFDQGAFGFTTGLSYMPSGIATRNEITDLVRVVTANDRLYATHTRALSEAESFDEAAETARATDVRLQFSHLAINQPSVWGQADTVLEWFHRLRSDIEVAFDVYPYDASSSALTQHLPLWVQEGGVELMRSRLADQQLRARVLQDLQKDWWGEGSWNWERFIISAAPGAEELMGCSIAKLADESHVTGEEMAIRLCEIFGNAVHIVLHYREERDVIAFMRDNLAVIGSDGLALPASVSGSRPHPRSYGSFPRILGRFVRELGVMTLTAAIRKMTSAPADRLKLRRRGRLKPGYFADVIIIDTNRVTDRATFLQPIALADGIDTVIVNGKPTLLGGQDTGSRSGRLLRYGVD
jgi:N-acyl-D-amino-acid deacylase